MMMIIVVFSAAQTIREHSCTDCCKTKRKKRYGDIKEDDLQRGNNEVHSICVPYGPLFPDENAETVIPLFFFLFLFYTSLSSSPFLLKRSKLWLMTLVFVSLATRTYVVHVQRNRTEHWSPSPPPRKKKTKKIRR